ncbi:MAG: PilN domain-containing protein [Mizugakiibacter sp.]|uniref:PilN domain-containing protein n=1 Tax=Mizugakiibacter sp. TaxID=1972610 RepID=UPI0031CA23A2|nr:PilN domain-containing protein [Xanthomonadaceae bacterium]
MKAIPLALAEPLERARQAWRHSPLPRFCAWWGGELAACLPARLRAWLARGPELRLLEVAGDTLSVARADDPAPLARIDLAQPPEAQRAALREACAGVAPPDLRLVLCLPAAQALLRRVTLPAATAQRLRQVLAFEMDRQTPFRADQVHYDQRVLDLAADGRTLTAEFALAPRAALDPLVARVEALGAGLDAVDLRDADGARLGFNLLPADRRAVRPHPRRRLNFALAGVALLVLLLAMAQWVDNRGRALEKMRAQVEAMRGDAEQVARLRRTLDDGAAAAGFLAARKRAAPSMLELLSDLSQRLPATTWLERFSVDADGRIGLQGQAAQAAALIDLLKGSPVLSEPSFQGVIQPDPRTGKERFYLVAKLRQPAEAGRAPAASR